MLRNAFIALLVTMALNATAVAQSSVNAQVVKTQLQAWLSKGQGPLDAAVLTLTLENTSKEALTLAPSHATVTGEKLSGHACSFYTATSWKPPQTLAEGSKYDFVLKAKEKRVVRMVFFCHTKDGKRPVVHAGRAYSLEQSLQWGEQTLTLRTGRVKPQQAPGADEGI